MIFIRSLLDQYNSTGISFRIAFFPIFAVLALKFIFVFIKTRLFYKNLPGPPHSWIWGSLPALGKVSKRYPKDINIQVRLNALVQEYDLYDDGVMYLDTFPFRNDSHMIVFRGEFSAQVATVHAMKKHPLLKKAFGRVLGLNSIGVLEGAKWKKFRAMFNPGFAAPNITSLIPAMLEEGEVFVSRLSAIASTGASQGGYTPSILHLLKDLTADIIMRLTIGTRTNCQETPNDLIGMICAASEWPQIASMNPLQKFNPVPHFMLRYYDWKCKSIIRKMVLERWEEIKSGKGNLGPTNQSKVILDLALNKYREFGSECGERIEALDPELLDILCDNIKGFLFGGQDTTAAALSWIIYELFQRTEIVAEVRREHDKVFGPDPDNVSDALRARPHLINSLPWTTAVIKESMRLHNLAAGIRAAEGIDLVHPGTGRIYPTKNQMIFIAPQIPQHDSRFFPNPDQFVPTRFLPDNPNTQKIDPEAYRPFERGPRTCIGQVLSMTEMKVILCLVARRFTFEHAYLELNRRRGTTAVKVEREGGYAYPIMYTTTQPKDGIPMWVKEEVYKK